MNKHLKARNILPLLHFALSFLYERTILVFALDRDIIATIAKNQNFSDSAERVMGYVLAKLFAAVFIGLLWHMIFFAYDNRKLLYVKVAVGVTLAGCVITGFLWPDAFIASQDNLITFSYALRFWPEYWHSAYSSIVFTACMMVIPHAAFITVFQWLFACFTFVYLYRRIYESPVLKGKGRGAVFAVFLMPQIYTLLTNSYRTEIYALFCTFVMSKCVMDLIDEKKASALEFAGVLLMIGLLSVWRSEGIILGVFLAAIWIFFLQKPGVLKGGLLFLAAVGVIVLFMIPQKLGDAKYYGKDYSFINSFPTLQNILNASGANLGYEGAQDDLAAIDAVAPISLVKLHGMDGYRRYNYSQGRGDINQSLASEEAAAAYMKAYYSLVLHNPVIYAKTQITMLTSMLMITKYAYVEYYYDEAAFDLPPWKLEIWDIGAEDLAQCCNTASWEANTFRQAVAGGVKAVFDVIDLVLRKIYFYTILLICIPLLQIWIFFREAFLLLKKRKGIPGIAALAFTLLGQAFAIVLVMPANVLVYLHAYYFTSLIMVIGYFLHLRAGRQPKETAEKAL